MKILAFSPFGLDAISGNIVTLKRVRDELARRGHEMRIVTVSPGMTQGAARLAVESWSPDVLHFYHAYKTGRLLPAFPSEACVVTLSGTDVNHDLENPERRAAVERALAMAGVVTTYNPSLAERIRNRFPGIAGGIRVLPKGVTIGDEPFDLKAALRIPSNSFVFLLAGGIRPVKNNLLAPAGMRGLGGGDTFLVFVGPVLDEKYGEAFREELESKPWARHLTGIPHAAMPAAYRASDVVLNTSRSEGISNTLLEAMHCGRAILAADIPGNRDLLREGETALLYRDQNEFQEKARRLREDAGLRKRLGDAARADVRENHSTKKEVDALLKAYEQAGGCRRSS